MTQLRHCRLYPIFLQYKKAEKTRLDDLSRDNKVKDDSRKEELEELENKLRRQKDSLDEEKRSPLES